MLLLLLQRTGRGLAAEIAFDARTTAHATEAMVDDRRCTAMRAEGDRLGQGLMTWVPGGGLSVKASGGTGTFTFGSVKSKRLRLP